MVQARKQQINDLKAYVTKYTYTVTLGTSYTNLPSGFKDSTVTKISGGDSSVPTRGIITGGSGGSVRIKLFEDGRDIVESNNVVFGRLTESGGTFRVTYNILNSGVEETVTLSGSGSIVVSMLFTEVMKFEEIPIDASIISSEIYDTFPAAITNHNLLLGLDGDDHTQYHNDARGDARYALLSNSSVSPTPNTLVKRGPSGHIEGKYLDLSDAVGEEPATGDIRVNNTFSIKTKVGSITENILLAGQFSGKRALSIGGIFTTKETQILAAERIRFIVPYIDDDGSLTRQNQINLSQTQFDIEFDSPVGGNNQRLRVDAYGIAVNKSLTNKGQVRTLDGDILVSGSSTDASVATAVVGVKTNGTDKNILIGRSEAATGTGLPGPSNAAANTYISGSNSVVLQYQTTDRVVVNSTETTIIGPFTYTHGNKGGGTEHTLATTSVAGFMSSGDKTKIDGLPTSFITDHGLLSGLSDDDHTQYILVNGSRSFSNPISGVTGTSSSHLITKGQLDAYAQGVDWQNSVLSVGLNTPPGSPTTGDRYVIGISPTGTWVGSGNKIAEWSGTDWVYTTPNKGFTTQDESTGINYNYNGTAWVTMGATISHATLIGLGNDDHTQYHNDARGDARYAPLSHTQAWSTITGTPTLLSGYGITNGAINTRSLIAGNGLTGGGNLQADRTFTVLAADTTINVSSSGIKVGVLPFSAISSTPTTLAGYGIGDAAALVHNHDHNTLINLTAGNPHTQYTLRTDGTSAATADKWAIRDSAGGVLGTTLYGSTAVQTPLLSGGTGDLNITTPTAGKYVTLDSKAGVVLRYNGNNVMIVGSNITLSTSLNFQFNIDGLVSHLATGTGTGKKLTVKGQSTGAGKGGTLYLLGGDGTTDSGDVEIGRGTTTLYKQTKDSHAFSVQDATVPATVRTPFEIIRKDGVSFTNDTASIKGDLSVSHPSGGYANFLFSAEDAFVVWRFSASTNVRVVDSGFSINNMPIIMDESEATAGQLRTIDGEILNAKGSTGAEVCLVSYNKTLTSAVFGSDGAGLRTTVTSVLAGSTSAQLVAAGTAVLEARSTGVTVNGPITATNLGDTLLAQTTITYGGAAGTTDTTVYTAPSGSRMLITRVILFLVTPNTGSGTAIVSLMGGALGMDVLTVPVSLNSGMLSNIVLAGISIATLDLGMQAANGYQLTMIAGQTIKFHNERTGTSTGGQVLVSIYGTRLN